MLNASNMMKVGKGRERGKRENEKSQISLNTPPENQPWMVLILASLSPHTTMSPGSSALMIARGRKREREKEKREKE